MTTSPTAQTVHVQLSQESTLMDAMPAPKAIPHGGDFGPRTFNAGAVQGPAPVPAEPEVEMPTPEQESACPVHPWCIEAGEHTWHNSETVEVTAECGIGEKHRHSDARPYLEMRLISEDNPTTGVRGDRPAMLIDDCEVDADGARREVAKIREALPRIEAMADLLDGKPDAPSGDVTPVGGEHFEVPTAPPEGEKAQQAAYRPPMAADGLPEPGIDDSTVIALNLLGLELKAGIHVSDDEHATRTIAVWTEGHRDGTDLDALDAERVAAALPVFTEQFQALARRLAEQPVPYSVTEQAEAQK